MCKINESSVQLNLQFYQDIIARMENNSRVVKTWCITIVSAVLIFFIEGKGLTIVNVIPFLLVVFWYLDIYYLAVEKGYRDSYNSLVDSIHNGSLNKNEIYRIKASDIICNNVLHAFFSFSTLPFYTLLFVMFYYIKHISS